MAAWRDPVAFASARPENPVVADEMERGGGTKRCERNV
jgi:hypothetical protein